MIVFQSPSKSSLGVAQDVALVGLDENDQNNVTFQITGTFVGTITFEGTMDGTTFAAIQATPLATGTAATTATVVGLYRIVGSGLLAVQARMSAYTSGAAVVTASISVPA